MLNWLSTEKLSANSPMVKSIKKKLDSYVEQQQLGLPVKRTALFSARQFSDNVKSALQYLKGLAPRPGFLYWDTRYAKAQEIPFSFGRHDLTVAMCLSLYLSASIPEILPEGSSNFLVLLVDSDQLKVYLSNLGQVCAKHKQIQFGFLPAAWTTAGKTATIDRLSFLILWNASNGHANKLAVACKDVIQFGTVKGNKDLLRKNTFPKNILKILFGHFKVHIPDLTAIATLELYASPPTWTGLWSDHPYACVVAVQCVPVTKKYSGDLENNLRTFAEATVIKPRVIFDPPAELFEKGSLQRIAQRWPEMKQISVVHTVLAQLMKSTKKLKEKANDPNAHLTEKQKKEIATKYAARKAVYLEYSTLATKLIKKDLEEPMATGALFTVEGSFCPPDWSSMVDTPYEKLPRPPAIAEGLLVNKDDDDVLMRAIDQAQFELELAKVKSTSYRRVEATAAKRGAVMLALPESLKISAANVPQEQNRGTKVSKASEELKKVFKLSHFDLHSSRRKKISTKG